MRFSTLVLSAALITVFAYSSALAAPVVVAQAQTQATGTVTGTVLDARRTPLGGAAVEATGFAPSGGARPRARTARATGNRGFGRAQTRGARSTR